MSDRDVERLMKNANQDAKVFAKSFKKSVEHSTVRKTSREKDAKRLADRFVQQIDGMTKVFQRTKRADTQLPVVFESAGQVQQWMQNLSLNGVVTNDWEKVSADLDQIAQQFGYTRPH